MSWAVIGGSLSSMFGGSAAAGAAGAAGAGAAGGAALGGTAAGLGAGGATAGALGGASLGTGVTGATGALGSAAGSGALGAGLSSGGLALPAGGGVAVPSGALGGLGGSGSILGGSAGAIPSMTSVPSSIAAPSMFPTGGGALIGPPQAAEAPSLGSQIMNAYNTVQPYYQVGKQIYDMVKPNGSLGPQGDPISAFEDFRGLNRDKEGKPIITSLPTIQDIIKKWTS